MTSSDTAQAPSTGEPDEEERHRLATLSGLAALALTPVFIAPPVPSP